MMFIPWHFSTLSAWPIGFVADTHLVLWPYFAELVLLALFLNKLPNFSYIFCDRENMSLGTYILTPIVTNINFLLTMSIVLKEIRSWEWIKWSPEKDALIFYQIGRGRNVSCIQMICWNKSRQGCSWRTGRKDWHWDRNFGYGGG